MTTEQPVALPAVAPRRLAFVPAFDGVRGIAVLLVVAYHSQLLAPSLYGRVLPKGGSLGVDIFFVLSGFLITALLLREQTITGTVRYRGFYRRRALRLLPALVVFLGAQAAFAYVDDVPAELERSSLLASMFYVANWKIVTARAGHFIAPGLAHIWSLSIEEQFYIVWPLLLVVFLGVRRRLPSVVTVMAGAIAGVVVLRAILLQHTPPGLLYFRTDMRADELLMGALAAQLWVRGKVPRRSLVVAAWISVAFVAVLVARVTFNTRFLFYGGYTLLALAVAIILLAIVDTRWSGARVLSLRPLRAVGRVAYGLYLWHYLVFIVVSRHTSGWSAAARLSLGLSVTALVTLASWYLVERPFLRLKAHD